MDNFVVTEAKELIPHEKNRKTLLHSILNERYDFFISHQSNVEKNFIRMELPYSPFDDMGRWGPWLDTKIVYRKLYPNLPNYDLKSLIETFIGLDGLTKKARIYCREEKLQFHNALFDAIACMELLNRLSDKLNLPNFLI